MAKWTTFTKAHGGNDAIETEDALGVESVTTVPRFRILAVRSSEAERRLNVESERLEVESLVRQCDGEEKVDGRKRVASSASGLRLEGS